MTCGMPTAGLRRNNTMRPLLLCLSALAVCRAALRQPLSEGQTKSFYPSMTR